MAERDQITRTTALYVFLFYSAGWAFDWGFIIAKAFQEDAIWLIIASIAIGWLPALIWPLHASFQFWSWILGGTL